MSESQALPPVPPSASPTTSETPKAPPVPPPVRPHTDAPSFPPTWAVLLMVLGFLILIAAGVGTLLTNRREHPTGGAEPLTIGKLLTFTSPPTLPEDLVIMQENGRVLPIALPTELELAQQTFPVVPVTLDEGRLPLPSEGQKVLVWVYGTVVNYVVGVPYSTTPASLLPGLTSSDRISLTLNNGTQLIFGSPQAQRLPATDTTPLAQNRPGLTLVLLGGKETDRLIVQARYLPEAGATLGGAQQLGTLRVAVSGSDTLADEESGRGFVVEFQMTNEGTEPVDTAAFDLTLEDGAGQRYLMNAEVSALGDAGPLPGSIAAGATVTASAGYRIPDDLQPPLVWVFRADPTSAQNLRFSLAYQPPLPSPAQPQVTLTSAFMDEHRNVIVINGTVWNSGESPLSVMLDNVKLTSGAGAAELRAATPTLPWTIPGGEQQDFEVQFSRPGDADSVLLDIWGFTFEIEGLP